MKNLKNRVQLIGRLGRDPELRLLDSGKSVVNFSLATSENFTNSLGEKKEETQWHHIVAWGNLAEISDKYLRKGSEVAIEGKLTHRSYEGKDGQKRFVTEVVAKELLMMGKPQEAVAS